MMEVLVFDEIDLLELVVAIQNLNDKKNPLGIHSKSYWFYELGYIREIFGKIFKFVHQQVVKIYGMVVLKKE